MILQLLGFWRIPKQASQERECVCACVCAYDERGHCNHADNQVHVWLPLHARFTVIKSDVKLGITFLSTFVRQCSLVLPRRSCFQSVLLV